MEVLQETFLVVHCTMLSCSPATADWHILKTFVIVSFMKKLIVFVYLSSYFTCMNKNTKKQSICPFRSYIIYFLLSRFLTLTPLMISKKHLKTPPFRKFWKSKELFQQFQVSVTRIECVNVLCNT